MADDAVQQAEHILDEPGDCPPLLRRCIVSVMKRKQLRGGTRRQKFTGAVDI